MKNFRKDNKGFSLVELIVVVLIMAIIAVALAPQILKWVNNSRISADNNTMQQVISNAQTALSNEAVYAEVKNGSTFTLTVNNTPSSNTNGGGTEFVKKFNEYTGGTIQDFKTKQKNAVITVSVTSGGKVTGSISGTGVQSDITDN